MPRQSPAAPFDDSCLRLDAARMYIGGVSPATFFRYMKNDPDFPKGIKLSQRCTVFRKSDLDAYLQRKASQSQAAA